MNAKLRIWNIVLLSIALLGALVFVKLLMVDGDNACTMVIGNAFAGAVGENWKYFASYLGAVGSFFSGSNTVSNMPFGGIHDSIAANPGKYLHEMGITRNPGRVGAVCTSGLFI